MRIKFKLLTLENFMSYKNATIRLDKNGYILITGVNKNPIDGAKSNGTGKSSLFSGISWALTGLTVSGSKEVANINSQGVTKVTLEFEVDSIQYKIVRTKNPSNLKIFVDSVDKSGKGIRDTEKILNDYLPDISHSLLNSVIILGQGLPQRFTNNTPSGRKEILEKLSNSDFMISDLKNRVADRTEHLKSNIRLEEDNLLKVATEINSHKQRILTNKALVNEISKDPAALQASIDDLKIKVVSIEDDLAHTSVLLGTDTDALNELLNKISVLMSEYRAGKNNLKLEDLTPVEENIRLKNIEISVLESEITRLENIKDTCPTCGQKLPNVEKIDTTAKRNTLNGLKDDLSKLQLEKIKKQELNNTVIAEYDNLFKEKETLLNNRRSELNRSLSEHNSTFKKLENEKANTTQELSKLMSEMTNLEERRNFLLTDIANTEKMIDELSNKVLYYNNVLTDYNNRLDALTKMNNSLKRDFRGYLLSNVIDYISKKAKGYSEYLFGTECLDFYLDGNNIVIKYDSKDYEVLSGGEKQKVDIIIQFSIRDMLCTFLNFSSNILVLDEITDSLDTYGSQKMFNLVSTKLNDVESVYIISHHTDIEIPYDEEIVIEKGSDKLSRIV